MKCIYCNNEDTTLSDIVPESLTNAKIARKNVCRITHNNNFGSEFEYDVISKLSFLRNHLGITNKENKYPKYDAIATIDGVDYKKQISNTLDIFNGNFSKSTDGKHLFGDYEKLKQIAEKKR